MADKLTQELTEATVVSNTNDAVPIYSAASPDELRYIKPNNLIPDATTTVKGKVELATDAETITGTDTVRAMTPSNITAKMDTDGTLSGNLDTRIPTQKAVKTYSDRNVNTLLNINPLYSPQGFLINGKIVPSVSSSDLTVAIKTLAGTDPSASDPVYVRIGDTVRTISAALSVTKNDGTNWFNAGSSELATKEIDYFVYLGYNATDGVVIGFSRMPGANQYSDFSTTTTNEKYCAISTITNATSTDYYENVGRFAATLGVSATYLWTVPTFTAQNLIQRPIYETRWLDILPTIAVSGGTAPTYSATVYKYKVTGSTCAYTLSLRNTSGGTAGAGANAITIQSPFDPTNVADDASGSLGSGFNYENGGTICGNYVCRNTTNKFNFRNVTSVASIIGTDQSDANRMLQAQGFFTF